MRRHTSYIGDWSSDVCSSDLVAGDPPRKLWSLAIGGDQSQELEVAPGAKRFGQGAARVAGVAAMLSVGSATRVLVAMRSEERRVGRGSRWGSARECGAEQWTR